MKKIYPTYDELQKYSESLAEQINNGGLFENDNEKFKSIIVITRGGMLLGLQLAQLLDIKKIYTIGVSSYENKKQKEVKIINNIDITFFTEKEKFLIVDDLIDGGKTIKKVIDSILFLNKDKSDFKIATYYYKPHALIKPDFTIKSTKAWIVFPYEKSN